MILRPIDYIPYIKQYKPDTSPITIKNYNETLSAIGIDAFDTENMTETWQTLLNEKLPNCGYVHVQRFIAIMSAWAKRNQTVLAKDINYSKLHDSIVLKTDAVNRVAYTDDELMLLFAGIKRDSTVYNGLYNLCLVLLYSGIRISAAEGIKWDNVRKVENYPVWTFKVDSKGTSYYAFISENVIQYIRKTSLNCPTLVYHEAGSTTPFHQLYRQKLIRAFRSKALFEVREHTSVFHSFRKTFSQKLLTNPELDPKSYTYQIMMGHIPHDTTATKYYVTPTGQKEPLDLIRRCADAYSKSDLVKMTIGLI